MGKQWNADRIVFTSLNNWGTFSKEEHQHRAIHSPRHSLHSKLIDMLADDLFKLPEGFYWFSREF